MRTLLQPKKLIVSTLLLATCLNFSSLAFAESKAEDEAMPVRVHSNEERALSAGAFAVGESASILGFIKLQDSLKKDEAQLAELLKKLELHSISQEQKKLLLSKIQILRGNISFKSGGRVLPIIGALVSLNPLAIALNGESINPAIVTNNNHKAIHPQQDGTREEAVEKQASAK